MRETKWKIPYRTENTEEKLQQIKQKDKEVETRKANKGELGDQFRGPKCWITIPKRKNENNVQGKIK